MELSSVTQEIALVRLDNEEFVTKLKIEFERNRFIREHNYFKKCYEENKISDRVTIIAFYNEKLAGCGHLIKKSDYPYFNENNIPEINDLNVFPAFRKKGIAGTIIDELEKIASETYDTIGIGVGLYQDYGSAQRLYCKKGYIPDGNGIQYNEKQVLPGTYVLVDDYLNLYFTKRLR